MKSAVAQSPVALVALVVLAALTTDASAQSSQPCLQRASRWSLAGAVSAWGGDMALSSIEDSGPDERIRVGSGGVGVTGIATIPVRSGWSLRVSGRRTETAVTRETLGGPPSFSVLATRDEGDIVLRRYQVGVMNHGSRGRRVCGYVAISAGLYEVVHQDVTGRSMGASGLVGLEVPFTRSGGLAMDFELDWVFHDSRPPLSTVRLRTLGTSIGYRYRF